VKVSDILLNYLLAHKKLQLTGLGTFNLTGSYIVSDDDKKIILPQGSVEFILDPATPEDQELIAAISSETGKIKPLASADLDSLIIQGKQLMNISKPFMIEGIGTLQKNHRNEVEYIPLVDEVHRGEHEKRLEEPGEAVRFDDNYLKPSGKRESGSRNLTLALLAIVAIGILGLVVYYFYNQFTKENSTNISLNEPPARQEDTANKIISAIDTATNAFTAATDSIKTVSVAPAAKDSFYVVLEMAKRDRAIKRYADLTEWGHKVVMTTKDSVDYSISFPIKAPLADTAKHRDSLGRFFGKKAWIEKQ
jgi:hypothetical protein